MYANGSSLMIRHAVAMTLCVAVSVCVRSVYGQHADIAVYQDPAGRITTHEQISAAQPETRLFRRNFDFFGPPLGIYAGDDPGIQMTGLSPPSGAAPLPARQSLYADLVPIHIVGRGVGNLFYWNGQGLDVSFGPPPANHELILESADGNQEFTLDGSRFRNEDVLLGVTDVRGGMHDHVTYVLENNGAAPARGFYLMGWQLHMQNLMPSKMALVGVTSPSAPGTALATTWLLDNLPNIRIAGDFDDSGSYEVEDVDLLVSAIASEQHDPSFDLTIDGKVDTQDLDLWRSLAGVELNSTKQPVLLGDANLDGSVDGVDFNVWNGFKQQPTGRWSLGDFDADGSTTAADLSLWSTNRFRTENLAGAAAPVALPEPMLSGGMLFWLAIAILRCRQVK